MKILKEIYPYLIIIIVVVLIRTFLVTPVRVDGESMLPTLEDHDIMILKKYDQSYQYGDIVILKYGDSKLVKRIIGVPGDHIVVTNGILYINEKKAKDPYSKRTNHFDLKELGYKKIPEGYYFVMGDNRKNSSDSRILGLIKETDILGTTDFRIFPFDSFGKVK